MAQKSRRHFGSVRQRSSGRWQARYRGPDGELYPAPGTFDTRTAAERWLSIVESQIDAGDWVNPKKGKMIVKDYLENWIRGRAGLRPNTIRLYSNLLDWYIAPHLGNTRLAYLETGQIRNWRSSLLESGVSVSTAAKAYRLLRAALNTAVEEDKIITRNPCRVKGADQEQTAERPVLTVSQVFAIAAKMPARFRLAVLLSAFVTLRWGEVTALRRCNVAADGSWIRVVVSHTVVQGVGVVVGPPKSRAGVRTLTVPEPIRKELVNHLATYTKPEADALLFCGIKDGRPLRYVNFYQRTKWTKTMAELGLKGVHFHDLRHAGNIWAAQTGTSTKDLMARMGHDDMRAALIYQRATIGADRKIANQLGVLADEHLRGGGEDATGAAPVA